MAKTLSAKQREDIAAGKESAGVVKRFLAALNNGNEPVEVTKGIGPARKAKLLAIASDRRPQNIGRALTASAQLHKGITPDTETTMEDLTAGFVKVARTYSEKHKVSPEAWLSMGVTPEVLGEAGVLAP